MTIYKFLNFLFQKFRNFDCPKGLFSISAVVAFLASCLTILPTISRWASSSVPISVSRALVISFGIENRCDKYLRLAPSSPFGPPYCKCLSKGEMAAIYSWENLVIIRHRSISYAFCIYNKMYCTSQNMSDIFSFDIPIVLLWNLWCNIIGDMNVLGRCKKRIGKW